MITFYVGGALIKSKNNKTFFTSAYLIMLIYRHLLPIALTWQSSCMLSQITIKNIPNLFVQACDLTILKLMM